MLLFYAFYALNIADGLLDLAFPVGEVGVVKRQFDRLAVLVGIAEADGLGGLDVVERGGRHADVLVDEAQEFRKLSFATNMSTLKGIDPNGSQRAWDLYVKSRFVETKNPGRALILASGTPITNTLGEMFSIQRLLGHGHLSTTMRYLHLARNRLTGTTSPLELLDSVPV